jgi:circadian clock protein KaiC
MTSLDVTKLRTGILGFDEIADGGLPVGRSTVISGTSGSCKTVFAFQFLLAGVRDHDQNGVFVTFEEQPQDLIANVRSFGWDFEALIAQKRIAVVDATAEPGAEVIAAGRYDLSALLARIESAIHQVSASRVILDAVGTLFPQVSDANVVRRELHRIHSGLRRLGVTTLITNERREDDGGIGRFGVEEFVADNVVVLRNRLEHERRRRTIEILKLRGATHRKGEFPFTVEAARGMTIIPQVTSSPSPSPSTTSDARVSFGVPELDVMCGGGLYRGSLVLVSGATGTGKTTLATEYVRAAIDAGERAMLVAAADESREQLIRNSASRGVDFERAERDGLLKIVCRSPEVMGLEDHLLRTMRDIGEFSPARVAFDSISSFERVASPKLFGEFIVALTRGIKALQITGLFTNTTPLLTNGEQITEAHVATLSDAVILLRYVELRGEMRRGLTVLKMRGTRHDKEIREYVIEDRGVHIKSPFRGVHGILTGSPTYNLGEERDLLGEMFSPERPVGDRHEAPRIAAKTIRRG